MHDRWRWFEGSRDPVDGARRNIEADQVSNPRELDAATRARSAVLAPDYEITIIDPLQVMVECEEKDEADGVAPGTHFNEFCRRNAKPTN